MAQTVLFPNIGAAASTGELMLNIFNLKTLNWMFSVEDVRCKVFKLFDITVEIISFTVFLHYLINFI